MNKYFTPKEYESRRMNIWKVASISFFFLLLIGLVILLAIPNYPVLDKGYDNKWSIYLKHIAGTVTVFFGSMAGFFITKCHSLKSEAKMERATNILFHSEFEDLIRHLGANMKIMAKLILQLKESSSGARVSAIHMINFKWPETSCLFSDDMAKIIESDDIESLTRMKVNLRNINNSADYLARYSESTSYSSRNMLELLEWELTRYFGYYVNFCYMKDHDFQFPKPEQLDAYIDCNRDVHSSLCEVFMDEKGPVAKDILVNHYLQRYLTDRWKERSVIIFE